MKALAAALVIVFVAFGGFVLLRGADTNTSDTQSQTNTTSGENEAATEETGQTDPENTQTEAKVITYTDNGFSPDNLTIKNGETVIVRNDSSESLDFASDEHPSHQENTDLNLGAIESGGSASFTTTSGTWGYHNHLKPTDTGSLTVE